VATDGDFADLINNPPQWSVMSLVTKPANNPAWLQWTPPAPVRGTQVWSVAVILDNVSGNVTLPYSGPVNEGPDVTIGVITNSGLGTPAGSAAFQPIDSQPIGQLTVVTFRPYRPYYLPPGSALQIQSFNDNDVANFALFTSGRVEFVQPLS
jgi:hypothetical protein